MRTLEDIMSGIAKYGNDEWDFSEKNKNYFLSKLSARSNFDYPFFAEHILGLEVTDFHRQPEQYIYDSRFILIIWPRGHGKTKTWSEGYSIWRLWKEKNIEIAITSSALEQSQRIIENIQRTIQDNEFLNPLVPRNRKVTWNKSTLNTTNGSKCFQKPFNSSSRGIHVDYLILDDILREENLSQEQIKDYFWSIFFPTIHTNKGQIISVGTPMTMKDLFADLQDKDKYPDWKVIKNSCVKVDENGKWVEPVWPQRFTLDELKKIQMGMGSLRFEREYMTNPLGGGASIFKKIIIGDHKPIEKPLEGETYYLGIDVAMKSGAKNDFLVFCILGKDNITGKIRQRKIERYKGWGEDKIIKRTLELDKIFNFSRIVVENTGISVGIVKTLNSKEKCPDVCDKTEGYNVNSRKSKEELISGLIIAFETEALSLLDNTIQYNELISFKAKEDTRTGRMIYESVGHHDDTVMACCLALMGIQMETFGIASIEFI